MKITTIGIGIFPTGITRFTKKDKIKVNKNINFIQLKFLKFMPFYTF